MKYLVCVDGSENADAAFKRACDLYIEGKTTLIVLFVHTPDADQAKHDKEVEVIQKYAKVYFDFLSCYCIHISYV